MAARALSASYVLRALKAFSGLPWHEGVKIFTEVAVGIPCARHGNHKCIFHSACNAFLTWLCVHAVSFHVSPSIHSLKYALVCWRLDSFKEHWRIQANANTDTVDVLAMQSCHIIPIRFILLNYHFAVPLSNEKAHVLGCWLPASMIQTTAPALASQARGVAIMKHLVVWVLFSANLLQQSWILLDVSHHGLANYNESAHPQLHRIYTDQPKHHDQSHMKRIMLTVSYTPQSGM